MTSRHAWLQKHPTPAARHGEFHWYPADGDRELRAACVERMRGIEPPAVLWELAPGRVAWARPFAAIAPHDGRRYVGLALTVVERPGASPAELLESLALPAAAPWDSAVAVADPIGWRERPALASQGATGSAVGEAGAWTLDDAAAVARTLLAGGTARIADPAGGRLPARLAELERWLPGTITARVRRGCTIAGAAEPVTDPVAALLVAAPREPRAERAWRLLVDLAAAPRERALDDVVAATRAGAVRALSIEERAELPDDSELVDVLHAWGRGRFDCGASAITTLERLAEAVALRVLGELLAGRSGSAVIAQARWHALLPAARRAALLDAVARRAPGLRELVEAPRA